jgi:hypothetical protein
MTMMNFPGILATELLEKICRVPTILQSHQNCVTHSVKFPIQHEYAHGEKHNERAHPHHSIEHMSSGTAILLA